MKYCEKVVELSLVEREYLKKIFFRDSEDEYFEKLLCLVFIYSKLYPEDSFSQQIKELDKFRLTEFVEERCKSYTLPEYSWTIGELTFQFYNSGYKDCNSDTVFMLSINNINTGLIYEMDIIKRLKN